MKRVADDFIMRLSKVQSRLETLAVADWPRDGLTTVDAATGDRWEAGQVWAHLGEFGGYWLGQVQMVVRDYHGEPVPFGRVSTDASRVEAIERDRTAQPVAMLWEARDAMDALQHFLADAADSTWNARGLHETRGVMALAAIIDVFLVGHYEEHAGQLEELLRS